MSSAYHIQITQEQKEFHLHIAETATLEQLHQAILILFQWKDDGFFKFSFSDREIHEAEADQPIARWFQENTTVQYTYSQVRKNEYILIKVMKSTGAFSHSVQLLQPASQTGEGRRLQAQLDALFPDEKLEQITENLLENIRTDLEQRKTIAPYLIISDADERPFLFYLDVLDNGMELMAFADEKVFIRSILNSMNEDPDLLFTDAFTFDFLYEDVKQSELPLYHGHNLCFKNEPGQLPRAMNHAEKQLAAELLHDFYGILKQTPVLPSLGDHKVLRACQNGVIVEDFRLSGSNYSVDDEEDAMPTMPRTNERIHLMLQAVPDGREIKVRLTAVNDHFTKTATVHMNPIAALQEEVDVFLRQLFQERGIAEAFILHSRNLHQLILPRCEKLGIRCLYYQQPLGADLFMAELLSQAFPYSDEERYSCSQDKIFS